MGRVATLSSKSFSASFHTRAVLRFLSSSRDGSRSWLNASLDSLGSSVGRWSIEMTVSSGAALRCVSLPPACRAGGAGAYVTGTGTVGLSKVVLTL